MENTAVDFNNPEALEEELKAMETPEEPKAKTKRVRKPRVLKVVCPSCEHEFDFEVPKGAGGGRGVLAGIALEDMTDDQLRIEYRNAKSVHYKQTKAKGEATDKAQERLDNVVARMEEKGIVPTARAAAQTVDANAIADLIKAGKVSVDDIQALLDN